MSCDNTNCTRRRQEMLNMDLGAVVELGEKGAYVIRQLLGVVKNGLTNAVFKNDALNTLALEIARLYDERNLLAGLVARNGDCVAGTNGMTLHFGPNNQYTLHVPPTKPAVKNKLVAAQLPLPFEE